MVFKELNDWLQVIGLFGVLGGLIFVGLQLRQDREIALAAAVAEDASARLSRAELVVDHADVWTKGLSGEPLSAIESTQFEELARAIELQVFNAWYRSKTIGTEQAADRFVREFALDIHTFAGLRSYWQANLERMNRLDISAVRANEWVTEVNRGIKDLDDAVPN